MDLLWHPFIRGSQGRLGILGKLDVGISADPEPSIDFVKLQG